MPVAYGRSVTPDRSFRPVCDLSSDLPRAPGGLQLPELLSC